MADRLEDTDPQSVQRTYAERFAADLAANRSEQGEITAQLAKLQTRLEQLQKDEGWLSGMQGSLPTSAPLTETAQDAKAVPQPRSAKGARAKSAQPKAGVSKAAQPKAAASKTAPSKAAPSKAAPKTASSVTEQPKAAARKPAAGDRTTSRRTATKTDAADAVAVKSPETAGSKNTETPLHQLLREFLPAGEPRLVREVHADLEKAHPDRKTSAQVVRNSLETLVKRGVISKEIQKGSAMYTAPKPAPGSEAPDKAADTAAAAAVPSEA
ncbi:hypothetical protein [Streptomyces fulvorobeus]|uniref:Type IV secretory pathway TrbL component n=1 Tax=Streptomyces fulvorobeus TaxID=284028 RepID=A0A7J0C090_9ACTN|nr:hypothetical protein [Streptomyces fulvorobeus]NYE39188.1 type IV secretory pathway TrbL component [Streptomyces fulvorobeus]GFM95394.1 hypothetical protein Sfulv_02050 [Streptomyces fulvorobeus]